MKLRDILEYQLIKTENFTITTYTLLEVIIILIITWLLLWTIKKVFFGRIKSKRIDKGIGYSVYTILKYIIWVIAISLVLDSIGVKITILIAGSAALLVGIGFGLQQFFKDLLSGVLLLFERSLKVGDVVQLEEIVGRVKEIGLRTSKIITRDNITVIIPNSKFVEDNVINWSAIDVLTRFHVEVGVAYGSDVKLVEKVLLDCAKAYKDIASDPTPFVRFNDFGESSLDFQLFFWTHNSFWVENIKSDLRFAIDKAFREHKIQIPFPQRDVHIKQKP